MTTMNIGSLIEERASLHEQMEAILDRADRNGRDLNQGDRQQYDKLEARFDEVAAEVRRQERANDRGVPDIVAATGA
jgi:hypothetical protein